MSARPHGYARYRLDGCRCYTCGWARAQYEDNRQRAIQRGTWQPYIDAEPVRIHIRHLQDCGMGLRAIAAAAGIDRKRLQAILTGRPERGTGPQEKVRPTLAAAVLTVEPSLENLAPSTLINPAGTRRRIQALVAMGWPQQHLADRLDMTPSNFSAMIRRDHVMVRRALAVRALYNALWRADPAQHGATAAGITRARKLAAANGWPPPAAWDDDTIDDPAATPHAEGAKALNRDERAAMRREEIEHLISFGISEEEIAKRLDMGLSTVRGAVQELRAGQRRDRTRAAA
ncbi:hypothetical protein ABZ636_03720 [Streptomyces sp. NPDC007251]|uniref:hypothetical protein n=1 Tax=Streptomyces sp. NPDC007251 TaxID=3154483 RepID=UPI0033FDBF0E